MNKQVAGFDASSLAVLQEYDWPGNVRELENVIERAMIVTTGDTLSIERSWFPVASATATRATPASPAETERRTILDALNAVASHLWLIGAAAKRWPQRRQRCTARCDGMAFSEIPSRPQPEN